MLKSAWKRLLKGSGYVEALEELTQEGIERGVKGAFGIAKDQHDEEEAAKPELSDPDSKKVSPAIALPRPQLIGIADKNIDDEPDRPGIPPGRVRRNRVNEPTSKEQASPADNPEEAGE